MLYHAEISHQLEAAKAREQDFVSLADAFAASEHKLRSALSQATDALLSTERQKSDIASAAAIALRDMQQRLQDETEVRLALCRCVR